MIVADANVITYLLLPGARTAAAEALHARDSDWRVPPLWRSEVRNALLGHVRQGDVTPAVAIAAMADAEELLVDSERDVASAPVLSLAAESGLSAYDCEYVALALELGVSLVTADRSIVAAFPDVALPL